MSTAARDLARERHRSARQVHRPGAPGRRRRGFAGTRGRSRGSSACRGRRVIGTPRSPARGASSPPSWGAMPPSPLPSGSTARAAAGRTGPPSPPGLRPSRRAARHRSSCPTAVGQPSPGMRAISGGPFRGAPRRWRPGGDPGSRDPYSGRGVRQVCPEHGREHGREPGVRFERRADRSTLDAHEIAWIHARGSSEFCTRQVGRRHPESAPARGPPVPITQP